MDRENADYRAVLDSLRERYGKGVVPLTFPIGKADGLSGVVDLLGEQGVPRRRASGRRPCPTPSSGTVDQLREMLVESACELDDDLINKYLEGEEITAEELVGAVRQGVREQKLFPVLATAGGRSIGLDSVLNAIVQLLPSPVDVDAKLANGSTARRQRQARGAGLQDGLRPEHRAAELRAGVLGHAHGRQPRLERAEEQGRARRPGVPRARQEPGADAAARDWRHRGDPEAGRVGRPATR